MKEIVREDTKKKKKLLHIKNQGSFLYLETYGNAPSTLDSWYVTCSPNILKASGAWAAIMQPSNTSWDPSKVRTEQADAQKKHRSIN